MDKKHKGGHSELLACAWLLRQGYEVYRNVSQCGLVDIVAERDGNFCRFDVKTAGGRLTSAQVAAGVRAIRVDGTDCRLVDPSEYLTQFICVECNNRGHPPISEVFSNECRATNFKRARDKLPPRIPRFSVV